jgi:hypothetical protein
MYLGYNILSEVIKGIWGPLRCTPEAPPANNDLRFLWPISVLLTNLPI